MADRRPYPDTGYGSVKSYGYLKERVGLALDSDRPHRPVAREEGRIVAERVQLRLDQRTSARALRVGAETKHDAVCLIIVLSAHDQVAAGKEVSAAVRASVRG